jgi:hypothetical protein
VVGVSDGFLNGSSGTSGRTLARVGTYWPLWSSQIRLHISVVQCAWCSLAVGVSHPVIHRKQSYMRLCSVSSHDVHVTTCGSILSIPNHRLGELPRITHTERMTHACVTGSKQARVD